MSHYKVGKKTE